MNRIGVGEGGGSVVSRSEEEHLYTQLRLRTRERVNWWTEHDTRERESGMGLYEQRMKA